MRTTLPFLCLLLGACAGDEVDPSNDCTKALYDSCATEHDCTSGNCRFFMGDDFAACTQTCDASTPCPAAPDGSAVECDANGICKPAEPTMCRLVPGA